jgi:ribonuclease J
MIERKNDSAPNYARPNQNKSAGRTFGQPARKFYHPKNKPAVKDDELMPLFGQSEDNRLNSLARVAGVPIFKKKEPQKATNFPRTDYSLTSNSQRKTVKTDSGTAKKSYAPTGKKPFVKFNSSPSEVVKAEAPVKKGTTLKIIPIGGCEEVGRNMTVFEYGNDIVVLDMGIQFPEEDMPGIDYIIPNPDYLKGKEKNIKGVIFSHGHLDHIGAAPIILERLGNPPIIGRDLTLAMLKHRQEDYQKDSAQKLKTINVKKLTDKIKLGIFTLSFFQIDHSIMDAFGVILETPQGTIIHTGDWTLEKDDNGEPLLDYGFLSMLPRPTILMMESLGAIDVRKSASSKEMKKNLTDLISNAPGRVVIGTFSSQIERIAWIIETAEQYGKKVALDGYSMKNNVEIAKKLGYIKMRKETIITIDQTDKYPDQKIVILCTGAQGEDNAVLSRIIEGEHRFIKLRKSDLVILSSSIIPGNERTIQKLKDNLYRQCDNVIHGNIMDIHVSGHGNREDIAWMLRQIKPTFFIPVYANHYMLKEAEKLAVEIGFPKDRIFVPDNGHIIEFNNGKLTVGTKKAVTDYIFVDGLGITDANNVVLRDRKMMAEDGMLVIIATVNAKNGDLIHNPDIISRGFVYLKENKKLIEMTRMKVKKILKEHNPATAPDDKLIKEKLRNEIGKFLYQKTEKRPMILPVVIEI